MGLVLPPGAGQPLVGPDGANLPTTTEEREKFRDVMMLEMNKSLRTIANGLAQGFPRFDMAFMSVAQSMEIVGAAAQALGIVEVDEKGNIMAGPNASAPFEEPADPDAPAEPEVSAEEAADAPAE